jgi:hypothetical protein
MRAHPQRRTSNSPCVGHKDIEPVQLAIRTLRKRLDRVKLAHVQLPAVHLDSRGALGDFIDGRGSADGGTGSDD